MGLKFACMYVTTSMILQLGWLRSNDIYGQIRDCGISLYQHSTNPRDVQFSCAQKTHVRKLRQTSVGNEKKNHIFITRLKHIHMHSRGYSHQLYSNYYLSWIFPSLYAPPQQNTSFIFDSFTLSFHLSINFKSEARYARRGDDFQRYR